MTNDAGSTPTREEVARRIGEAIVERYFDHGDDVSKLSVPLGSVSKAQLDSAIFTGLVTSRVIDVDAPPFSLALALRVTPGRAKNAVFAYNLLDDTKTGIDADKVQIDLSDSTAERIVMIVNDHFTRERLISELHAAEIYPQRGVEAARLVVTPDDFVRGMTTVLGTTKANKLKADYETRNKDWLAKIAKEKRSERGRRYLPEVFGVILAATTEGAMKALGAAPQ